jgi:hypothetical protein
MTRQRFTVPEAAEALGVSVEAIRGRLKRKSLVFEKEDGRTYVLLSDDDLSRHVNDLSDDRAALIDELRDRLRFTEEQLAAEREAHREARRIIGGLVQRIPELEAPRETPPGEPHAPETASGAPGGGETPDKANTVTQPRSWWRRIFGG